MSREKKSSVCPDPADLTAALIDREGGTNRIEEIENHVSICRNCRDAVNELAAARDAVIKGKPGAVNLSREFTERVMDALHETETGKLFENIVFLSRRALAACLVCVVFLLSVLMIQGGSASGPEALNELNILNGESYLYLKDELTQEDLVLYVFTE